MPKIGVIFTVLIFLLIFECEVKSNSQEQPVSRQESVWDYPRPPRVEKTSKKVQVTFGGVVIAETVRAKRVLETGHPPVYYIPPEDIRMEYLIPTSRSTTCEFKGKAIYYDIRVKTKSVTGAGWGYPDPAAGYEEIRDHIAFYPGLMDACFVNGERVRPEPGEYYGGWITGEIAGPFAGEARR
jgi:uncharacterized protein (DUF427 family)